MINATTIRRSAVTGLVAATLGASLSAHANEALIRRALATAMPDSKIESITPAPIKGVYEVLVDGDILYIDAAARTVMVGHLVDVASKANLTQARKEKLLAVPFAQLPLELAVKTVKGSGRRVFASFEDPNCVHCKQLHATLEKVDDYTLFTFMVPFLGPDSEVKLRGIWCAADPAGTLHGTLRGTLNPGEGRCEVPLDRLNALADKLRVSGTPTLFFQDGTRVNGALPLAQLELRLSTASIAAGPGGTRAK